MKQQKVRQTIKTSFLILFFAAFMQPTEIYAEETKSKVDYSQKSSILNPDTLQKGSDNYLIFWYFVKLTHEEVKNMKPLEIKGEFTKLGITTAENDRFFYAYSFFRGTMTNHKKSCENIAEIMKGLEPKKSMKQN